MAAQSINLPELYLSSCSVLLIDPQTLSEASLCPPQVCLFENADFLLSHLQPISHSPNLWTTSPASAPLQPPGSNNHLKVVYLQPDLTDFLFVFTDPELFSVKVVNKLKYIQHLVLRVSFPLDCQNLYIFLNPDRFPKLDSCSWESFTIRT